MNGTADAVVVIVFALCSAAGRRVRERWAARRRARGGCNTERNTAGMPRAVKKAQQVVQATGEALVVPAARLLDAIPEARCLMASSLSSRTTTSSPRDSSSLMGGERSSSISSTLVQCDRSISSITTGAESIVIVVHHHDFILKSTSIYQTSIVYEFIK